MLELHDDEGLSISRLWWTAWGLALVAAVAWVDLVTRLGTGDPLNRWTGLELAVGITCSVFSASCSVIVALKSSEVRVRRELRRLNAPQS